MNVSNRVARIIVCIWWWPFVLAYMAFGDLTATQILGLAIASLIGTAVMGFFVSLS
ncbi:hypothetical protein EDD27_3593 [Nonomuraea polychroma]|uniref:Uncharacterized protein n=1 Tax=Nonomuraea polychroma TaxID=46176 RepID=A0A438M5K2_9ACTN|nr:hypothetical protein [Nonomuraea polychroma]RVX41124.1 hypothetical protein EDD27_3593 [Nonomuraea polychroma]